METSSILALKTGRKPSETLISKSTCIIINYIESI